MVNMKRGWVKVRNGGRRGECKKAKGSKCEMEEGGENARKQRKYENEK
jgi:hypothetical protein